MKDELTGFPFSLLVGHRLDRWRRIHVFLLKSSGYPSWMIRPLLVSWKSTESRKRLSSDNSWLCKDRKPPKNFRQLQTLSLPPLLSTYNFKSP